MDMDMHYGHGHAAWAWTHSTALIMQHVSGQRTCMDAGMPIKSSVLHPSFSLQFSMLSPASAFQHRGQSSTASHGLVRQCPTMSRPDVFNDDICLSLFQNPSFMSVARGNRLDRCVELHGTGTQPTRSGPTVWRSWLNTMGKFPHLWASRIFTNI